MAPPRKHRLYVTPKRLRRDKKNHYEACKAEGMCAQEGCGEDAFVDPESGVVRAYCLDHLERRAANRAILVAEREAAGNCKGCNKHLDPEDDGFKNCKECRRKATKARLRQVKKRKKKGICNSCPNPTEKHPNGKHRFYCPSCEKKRAGRSNKKRDADKRYLASIGVAG